MKVGDLIEYAPNLPANAARRTGIERHKNAIGPKMEPENATMSAHHRMIAAKTMVKNVERLHAVVALLALLLTFALADRPHWMGIVLGAFIGALNFRGLAMVTQRLVSGETRTKNGAIGLLMGKFLLVGLAIAVILLALKPNALTLLVGLSLAPICLVLVVLRQPKTNDAPPSQQIAPQPPENHALSQLESP